MKKRIITLMLIISLGVSVVGCGKTESASSNQEGITQTSSSIKEIVGVKDARIKELIEKLQQSGFEIGEVKDSDDVDMYGAKSGNIVKINNQEIEIYNCDNFEESQKNNYIEADKNGTMTTPNGNVFLAYANDFVVMVKEHKEKDKLFEEFKKVSATIKSADAPQKTDTATATTTQTSGQVAATQTPASSSKPAININNAVVKSVLEKIQDAGLTIDKIANGGDKLHTVAFKPAADYTVTINGEKVQVYDCSNYPTQYPDFQKNIISEIAKSPQMLLTDKDSGGRTVSFYVLYKYDAMLVFKSHKSEAKLLELMR